MGDDIGTVAVLVMNLSDYLSVSTAATVTEGLESITESTPDFAILDVRRLDLDSVCFIRTISDRLPTCTVIVIAPAEPADIFRELTAFRSIGGFFRRPVDLGALLGRMRSLLTLNAHSSLPKRHMSPYVMRTFEYLGQHHADCFNIQTVADAVGVSASHLVHVFRAETGTTLRDCLLRIRVEVAKFLLEHSDHKLELIAQESGFCDASYLCRVFLRYTGQYPGRYRVACGRNDSSVNASPP
jgi:YesN/AraC family two-component response regulator